MGGGGVRRTWFGAVATCVALFVATLAGGAGAQDGFGFGAETSLGARVPSAAPGYQLWPAIARGNGSFVAAWAERPEDLESEAIVTRHLDDYGVPIEEAANVVARSLVLKTPDIDFSAGIYLVAFADREGSVLAVRLNDRGELLDETPITVAANRRVSDVDVARLGDGFAVTWVEEPSSGDRSHHAAVVGPNGEVRPPERVLVEDGPAESVVAGPPGEILVLWSEHSRMGTGIDAYGRRFDAALQPIGERFVVSGLDGTQEEVDAVFDGDAYVVAWAESRPEVDRIRVAPMTAEGVTGEPHDAGTHEYFIEDVDVAKAGDSHVVLWGEVSDDRIYGRRVSSDGTPSGGEPFVAFVEPGREITYDFGASGSPAGAFVVVDADDPRLGDNIFSARLDAVGSPAPRVLVSRAANGQRTPAVAGNGTDTLVVWQDWRSTEWRESFDSRIPERPVDIYAARLTPSGLVPPEGTRISTGHRMEAHPAVAWTGRSYLVGWTEYGSEGQTIGLRRISPGGEPGRARQLSGPGSWNAGARLAGAGGRGYVTWYNEYGGITSGPRVMGAAVDRTGRAGKPRALYAGDVTGWDVAALGRRFAVAWLGDGRLFTRTFSARGVPVSKRRFVAPAPGGLEVRIGSGGGGFLVTWHGLNEAENGYEVNALVLDSEGRRVTEPRRIGSSPISGAEVQWAGDRFVVAWHEQTGPETHALETVEVDTSGSTGGRDTLPLGHLFRSYLQLGMTMGGDGPIAVYERHAPEPVYGGVTRIFLRPVG